MVLQAVLSAALAFNQYVHGSGAGSLKGNFTNPDCYSLIFVIGFFQSIGIALDSRKWLKLGLGLGALSFLVGILLTGSRAAVVALSLGYLACLLALSGSRSRRWRRVAAQLLLVPAAVSLFLYMAGDELQLGSKLQALARGGDQANIKSRMDVLRRFPRTMLRSPWVGHGLGTFHLAYQKERPPVISGEDYMNVAHNDFVQWFVECGLLGGIAWTCMLFYAAQAAWRSYHSPTPWVAGQCGAAIGIATYCSLNFACPVTADFYWIGASLGLCFSLSRLERSPLKDGRSPNDNSPALQPPTPRTFKAWSVPPSFFLVLGGSWSLWFSWNCWNVRRLEDLSLQQESLLDWEGAISTKQLASRSAPQDVSLALAEAGLCRRAYLFSGKSQWMMMEEAALLKAVAANNLDLTVLLKLGRFYEDTHQYQKAQGFLDQASVCAPYSPQVAQAQARNLILRGELQRAAASLASNLTAGEIVDDDTLGLLIGSLECEQLGQGLRYLQQVSEARAGGLTRRASEFAAQRGDYAVALRLLKEGAKITKGRPDLLFQRALILGLSGEPAAELKELERLRRDPNLESDPVVSRAVWQRWCKIQISNKKLDLTSARLNDYLVIHPRELWARYQLAEIAKAQKNNSAARFALQEGLAYDEDGQMHMTLAALCESQGLKSLAASYYREALKLTPNRAKVEARLKRVQQDELELEIENSAE